LTQLYQQRLDRFRRDRDAEVARGFRLGWARLVTFLVAFGLYVAGDLSSGPVARGLNAAAVLALVGFLALVVWHRRVRARRRWAEARRGITLPTPHHRDAPAGSLDVERVASGLGGA
jgi:membrane associated rhomboid family serine protease